MRYLRDPNLRASDAEREQTAERLRQAHTEGEGRLDMADFQERLERCYGSKTVRELAKLVDDLPRQREHTEGGALAGLWPI